MSELLLSNRSLRRCSVLFLPTHHLFSLCSLDSVVSIILLSSSLFLSSVPSILLILSIEFSISVILFSVLKFLSGSSFYLVLLLLRLFFICFKHAPNCLVGPFFYDGCLRNLCQIIVTSLSSCCWHLLSFSFFCIQFEIFLVLGMKSDFLLKAGHFWYCFIRLWILFEPML